MASRKPPEFEGHPMPFPDKLEFRAVVKRVIDGDTYDFLIDVGLRKYAFESIRLKDLDTPEITRPKDAEEYVRGLEARSMVVKLLTPNKHVKLVTYKDAMTFERFVASVFVYEGGQWVSVESKLRAAKLLK